MALRELLVFPVVSSRIVGFLHDLRFHDMCRRYLLVGVRRLFWVFCLPKFALVPVQLV